MKVLVIAAHMDDETLGMGGTIARHVKMGDSVAVCVATQRAYGHRYAEKDVRAEKNSARKAAKILGCRRLTFLDLPDERLDEKILSVVIPLEKELLAFRPELVYTTHRGDNNQDHRAVFHATTIACRSIARHKVRRLLCYEVPSSTEQAPPFPEYAFQPNFYVNITQTLAKKLRAAQAYRRELRRFPHPRSIQGLKSLAQKRGTEIGFEAAEGFILMRDQWR